MLDRAFEIIREQIGLEDWMAADRAGIAAHIAEGFAQSERGESIGLDQAAAMLRQRGAARLGK